jgi:hypothetical protein
MVTVCLGFAKLRTKKNQAASTDDNLLLAVGPRPGTDILVFSYVGPRRDQTELWNGMRD